MIRSESTIDFIALSGKEKHRRNNNNNNNNDTCLETDHCSNRPMVNTTKLTNTKFHLDHSDDTPNSTQYFVYFNFWTRDNVNPPWLDILLTQTDNPERKAVKLHVNSNKPLSTAPDTYYILNLIFNQPYRNYTSWVLISTQSAHYFSHGFEFDYHKIYADHTKSKEKIPSVVRKSMWLLNPEMPVDIVPFNSNFSAYHWQVIRSLSTQKTDIFLALPGILKHLSLTLLEDTNLTLTLKWLNMRQTQYSYERIKTHPRRRIKLSLEERTMIKSDENHYKHDKPCVFVL